MDQNQTQTNNQTNPVDVSKYLITQQSDIKEFSKEKIKKDLNAIKKAELRAKQRIDISMGKKENEVTRAMTALSLINPFKGI
jgi:hypothetical protein